MTSSSTKKSQKKEAFVWIWLPEETQPIVAGRLEADYSNGRGDVLFNYGKSYLERINDSKSVMSIYEPELPLKAGALPLLDGLTMPGCIRDAAPLNVASVKLAKAANKDVLLIERFDRMPKGSIHGNREWCQH